MRFAGKAVGVRAGLKHLGFLVIALGASLLGGCAVTLPQDDAGATLIHFDGVRGQRYTEIFLIGGNPLTKDLKGGVYNTIGLNNIAGSGDSTPQALLDKVDVDALKKEYGMLSVYKNGPRLWTLDWVEVMAGRERDFSGLKVRWVTWLDVPKEMASHESVAYKPISVKRDTRFGINKGSPAFILDDPQGNSWVMKSASLIVDPNQTYGSLHDLGSRLKLAPGWKFRVVALDRDLVLTPDNGAALITQDELGNTYDRIGGKYSNFKP
jgi:hypothetical protein